MVFSGGPVKGGGNRRGQPIWVGPRTEGCSQAFGVLRPTMVLSAKVQSQIGAVSSVQIIEPLDLRPPVRVAMHSRVPPRTLDQSWLGLPSAGCCMTSCHHRSISSYLLSVCSVSSVGAPTLSWLIHAHSRPHCAHERRFHAEGGPHRAGENDGRGRGTCGTGLEQPTVKQVDCDFWRRNFSLATSSKIIVRSSAREMRWALMTEEFAPPRSTPMR